MTSFVQVTLVVLCAYIALFGLDQVDGRWSKWTPCSSSCGGGIRFRVHSDVNSASANVNRNCSGGYKVEKQTCNIQPCPVDGKFTEWGNWTTCTRSCGNGTQYRVRSCTNPAPAHGGRKCIGPNKETQNCNTHKCPAYCGKRLMSKLTHPWTCCGNQIMDSVDHICCNGKPIWHQVWKSARCCGTSWYDPYNGVCCQGNPQFVRGGFGKCCGNKGYNPRYESCCLGKVTLGSCCHGKAIYFPYSQVCCPNGKVLTKAAHKAKGC